MMPRTASFPALFSDDETELPERLLCRLEFRRQSDEAIDALRDLVQATGMTTPCERSLLCTKSLDDDDDERSKNKGGGSRGTTTRGSCGAESSASAGGVPGGGEGPRAVGSGEEGTLVCSSYAVT